MIAIGDDLFDRRAAGRAKPSQRRIGISSWLLTNHHKRIGVLYSISVTAMFFVGGFLRVPQELLTPEGDLSYPIRRTNDSRCMALS
jgi:hypothetical protein